MQRLHPDFGGARVMMFFCDRPGCNQRLTTAYRGNDGRDYCSQPCLARWDGKGGPAEREAEPSVVARSPVVGTKEPERTNKPPTTKEPPPAVDPVAAAILAALRKKTTGLTRTEISGLFSYNRTKAEIERALTRLRSNNQVRMSRGEAGSKGGRPVERWFAAAVGKAGASETKTAEKTSKPRRCAAASERGIHDGRVAAAALPHLDEGRAMARA